MSLPKISIIIPSYNQGEFLEESIKSIIDQDYPNVEIFVIDGGSTDNSIDIIKKHDQYLEWWVSEKDAGQSEALNKGLKRVTGEIVSWINSDDLLIPGALEKVGMHFLNQSDEVGLIHGGTMMFRGKRDLKNEWGYAPACLERNLAGMAFSQPSAFFLKKYLDIIGPNVDVQLHYGMDYDLFSRLACVCRFIPVKDIFSKYRLHEGSKTILYQNKFIGDWNRVFVNLCKNLGWTEILDEITSTKFLDKEVLEYYKPFNFLPSDDIIISAIKKKVLFYHFSYVLKNLYFNGEREEARRLLKYLQDHYPVSWMKDEKELLPIIIKLGLPEILLKAFKKIKRHL